MIPETRSEQYLASIIGEEVALPVPQSRIEHYLNIIAQNGVAPSSAGLINYDPDAAYPDGSIGKEVHDLDGDVSELKSEINEVEASFPQKSASGSIIAIDDGADNVPVVSLTAQIVPVQSGSGDPSPDNVRPISGFTGAEIAVANSIVFDKRTDECNQGTVNLTTAEISNSNYRVRTGYLPVKPNTEYVFNTPVAYVQILEFTDATYTAYTSAHSELLATPATYKTGETTAYIRVLLAKATPASGSSAVRIYPRDVLFLNIGEKGASADYSITFPAEAGTVYGGTLDVTNGVLTVTHKSMNMSEATWTQPYDSTRIFRAGISDFPGIKRPASGTKTDSLCSLYAYGIMPATVADIADMHIGIGRSGVNYVFVRDSGCADLSAFETRVSGQTFVYELAVPQTYQLTPTQVKTLLGLNNIWADTGDVSLVYRADPSMYTAEQIQTMLNAMVAPVEATTTASKAYSVNEFLILNNVLYKVISPISNGGTITINTNVSATTVGEQLTAILNS